ncbi:MAG: hypothetical protein HWQ44_18845 [Nostoc sp. JL34]|uniref:hypothetical protein n=1 Tax=Nostoc sp. JL34 TaxID=2815397 RepID=UPI001D84934A|nr:hypothetical protein [Nostoc sp. JL34]MBN3884943.1 hypothetical protein [Nostoc sp. JL34]
MNQKLEIKLERSLFQTKGVLKSNKIITTSPSHKPLYRASLQRSFMVKNSSLCLKKPTLKTWFFSNN